MVRLTVFAALAAASAGLAAAEEPSTRYCEAGYGRFQTDEDEGVALIASTFDFDSGNGGGFRGACQLELAYGFYGFGEYRTGDLDLDAAETIGPLTLDTELEDFDYDEWRIAAGYQLDLEGGIAAYGQVGVIRTEFGNDDPILAGFLVGDADDASTGVDLEAGIRWRPVERLELGGFGRWSNVGSLDLDSEDVPGALDLEASDNRFGGGVNAALRVIGPVWLSSRYEFSELDAFFIGARVAF